MEKKLYTRTNAQNDAAYPIEKAFIDVDEWRNEPIRHHYMHGGIEGTGLKFSFYFPDKEQYTGRFFQIMAAAPGSENASQGFRGLGNIRFAISNGAYFVESNMDMFESGDASILYRTSAVAAEYSRVMAQKLFGDERPYGYVFGGSGGSLKTFGCVQYTEGIWDGSVPFVIATPVAPPNNFTARVHALRVLRNKFPQIVDALEPGGSGNMYEGLNEEEADALREATRMGFPPYTWFSYESVGVNALPLLVPYIGMFDPTYYDDFWKLPGYLGADPNGSAVRDRIRLDTIVTKVSYHEVTGERVLASVGADEVWRDKLNDSRFTEPPYITVENAPQGDLYIGVLEIIFESGEAAGQKLKVKKLEGNKAIIDTAHGAEYVLPILRKVKEGDKVRLDNSDFIAIQTLHRHQVPEDRDYLGWEQFRDENGKPIYPQRPMLIAPFITTNGGAAQDGTFGGKMIVIQSMKDESAFPWFADWYRKQVEKRLGDHTEDEFRLWYFDHALHAELSSPKDSLHVVDYLGLLHQALLDVSDWVERGIAPPKSTVYKVNEDNQIEAPETAADRMGAQPIVTVLANGEKCAHVKVGEEILFRGVIDIPAGGGKAVAAEWSFDGDLTFPVKSGIEQPGDGETAAKTQLRYVFDMPGTYFVAFRGASSRTGSPDDDLTKVMNIDRVRVVVRSFTIADENLP